MRISSLWSPPSISLLLASLALIQAQQEPDFVGPSDAEQAALAPLLSPQLEDSHQCTTHPQSPSLVRCQAAFTDFWTSIFNHDFTLNPDPKIKSTEYQLPQYYEYDTCHVAIEFAPDPSVLQPNGDRDNWIHIWGAAGVSATRCAKLSKEKATAVTGGSVRVGQKGRIKVSWGAKGEVPTGPIQQALWTGPLANVSVAF